MSTSRRGAENTRDRELGRAHNERIASDPGRWPGKKPPVGPSEAEAHSSRWIDRVAIEVAVRQSAIDL